MITDKWRQAISEENAVMREALGLPPRSSQLVMPPVSGRDEGPAWFEAAHDLSQ